MSALGDTIPGTPWVLIQCRGTCRDGERCRRRAWATRGGWLCHQHVRRAA